MGFEIEARNKPVNTAGLSFLSQNRELFREQEPCFFKKGLRLEQKNRNPAELDFKACNHSGQAKIGIF